MLISNPLKKLQKSYQRKSDRKMQILLLLLRAKVFGLYCNFLGDFMRFPTDSNSASVLGYTYRIFEKIIFCSYLQFLLTLKQKSGEVATILDLSSIWETPFCKKS
jgi:hypothetical protein